MLCLANIDEASIVEESEGLQALREKVKSVEEIINETILEFNQTVSNLNESRFNE